MVKKVFMLSSILLPLFFFFQQNEGMVEEMTKAPERTVQVMSTKDTLPTEESFSVLAEKLKGIPYNGRGDEPTEGFSTATLTKYMYNRVENVQLSRHAHLQQELGEKVKKKNLKEGDLVFFKGEESTLTGIYLENGSFITATKDGVALRNLSEDRYWKGRFIEGKRLTDKEKKMLTPRTHQSHDHPAISDALSLLDRPYKLTGDTLAAFDCSFLVQHAFESMDIHLPRITYHQYEVGKSIPLKEALPGDVIYFSGTWQEGISHTGIYLGDRFFIHASGEEGKTTISYLGESWMKHFTGVKRFDHLKVDREHPIVDRAYQLLNIPYEKKGKSPNSGFDRSGFLHYVMSPYDTAFPQTLKRQWQYGSQVKEGEQQPGDVYFFRSDNNNPLPAVYIGNDQLIVLREDDGVSIIDPRFSHYWTKDKLMGIKRYEVGRG
ncbi:C40 family peptidase [Alteribacter aurantiacus]|uniref:C40 family peptidase n=1 Tax=Alteribacter aurantiacus TaxID=254410 RepID=UPI000407A913|nr:NlpC/P60 family protein [Alteribacter aurantiacus]